MMMTLDAMNQQLFELGDGKPSEMNLIQKMNLGEYYAYYRAWLYRQADNSYIYNSDK
jgi:hypothetical protein